MEYNRLRNKSRKLVQNSRNKYIADKLLLNKNDPRKSWQILNNLMGKVTKSIEDTIEKAFSKYTNSNKVIVKNFATEFQSSVSNILPKCSEPMLDKKDYLPIANTSMFFRKARD